MQIAGDGGELVGAARVLVCTFAMEPQTFDFLVPNRECVDYGSHTLHHPGELNRFDKKICRYLRALSLSPRTEHTTVPRPRAQLDQHSAPSQVDDGAQSRKFADNGGDLETASRRGTNIDGRGFFL